MKSLLLSLLVMVLSGCTNEQIYRAIGSPDPQGPPVRYPLDFPVCYPIAGLVVAPLHISLWGAGIPDPAQVMSLRQKDPNADGCFMDLRKKRLAEGRVSVEEKDSIYGGAQDYTGWMPLDKSGRGYSAASAYRNQLLNAKDLQGGERKGSVGCLYASNQPRQAWVYLCLRHQAR